MTRSRLTALALVAAATATIWLVAGGIRTNGLTRTLAALALGMAMVAGPIWVAERLGRSS